MLGIRHILLLTYILLYKFITIFSTDGNTLYIYLNLFKVFK